MLKHLTPAKLAAIGLAACIVPGTIYAIATAPDYGRCMASHVEEYEWLMPVIVGYVTSGTVTTPIYSYIPQRGTREVCDRHEFPNGRPAR